MSTPTTETPEQLAWRIEEWRLYGIHKQMRDEMALLPRTDELMKHYEKKYTDAHDDIMRHCHPSMIETLMAQRELIDNTNGSRDYEINRVNESIVRLLKRQRAIREPRKASDWDIYFSIRKPEQYFVNVYFPRPEGAEPDVPSGV